MSETIACERAVIAAPFGCLGLRAGGGRLLGFDILTAAEDRIRPAMALLEEAARQFQAYFEDPGWTFSLPLIVQGSIYRQSVWRALTEISPGSVKNYGRLALDLGSAPRAVAGACRANAFPIVIPCHRVVAADGLGGYCGQRSGPYLDIKRWLLRHEGYESG